MEPVHKSEVNSIPQRPDLMLMLLDTYPTGLLLVAGLDASNRELWENYDSILEEYVDAAGHCPPVAVISREHAIPPDDRRVTSVLETLKRGRADRMNVADVRSTLALASHG